MWNNLLLYLGLQTVLMLRPFLLCPVCLVLLIYPYGLCNQTLYKYCLLDHRLWRYSTYTMFYLYCLLFPYCVICGLQKLPLVKYFTLNMFRFVCSWYATVIPLSETLSLHGHFCHVDIHTLCSLGNSYLSGIQFIFNVYLLNLTLSLTGFKVKFYLWRIVNDLVGI